MAWGKKHNSTEGRNTREKTAKTEFKYEVDNDFGDRILEEGPNTCIMARRISWNGKPFRLDIRKYTYKDKDEVMLRGIGLSDEGADELTCVLVESNCGSTRRILRAVKARDDFDEAMLNPDADLEEDDENSTEYFDPKQLLNIQDTTNRDEVLSTDSISDGADDDPESDANTIDDDE